LKINLNHPENREIIHMTGRKGYYVSWEEDDSYKK